MKTAIIGLPMVGKTSLFTILTGVHEAARVGSMETRVGVAKVPDQRLTELAKIFEPPKVTHATVEYLDFPAISKEALRDPSYLASLRVVDALAHVLRTFESDSVPHEKGSVDPLRDAEDVDMELILSDLVVVEKRMERVEKDRKKQRLPELDKEMDLLVRCKEALENNQPLRSLEFEDEDEKRIRGFQFLSLKPMLYVMNLGEEDAAKLHEVEQRYRESALGGKANTGVTAVCGKIEAELAGMSDEEKRELLEHLTETEGFEQFLQVKFLGAKRFSLEGGESFIASMDELVKRAGEQGVQEIVIGMA
ncbi:MAG TPA: redox-regulated ATPase YchF, partial [Solibacterales bacterium]|nr:redox-regulated ATPase YchF [Bryobacterales bacterium]